VDTLADIEFNVSVTFLFDVSFTVPVIQSVSSKISSNITS